jgi:protein-S-isoprenylcysteine O-methyltransferase Ste14
MYSGALLYLIGFPPALGSWWGLLGLAVLFPAIIWRLIDEEHVLAKNLAGYTEYCNTVKYRLIPRVW